MDGNGLNAVLRCKGGIMMCPLTCKIVKEAIKRHEEAGICMQEYIDYQKDGLVYCQMCTRNEKSTLPKHLKTDNGMCEVEM